MTRYIIFVIATVSCAAEDLAAQAQKWILKDTIDVSFAPVRFSGCSAFQEHSPLIGFKNGVFMPYERLWFYQIDDPKYSLESFVLSHIDSSLYLVVSAGGVNEIIHLKKNAKLNQEQKTIAIPTDVEASVYPIQNGMFYLLAKNASNESVIKFYDGRKLHLISTSKARIRRLVPIDDDSFVIALDHDLLLFKKGRTPVNMFFSEVEINDLAVTTEGIFILSTVDGVYSLARDFKAAHPISRTTDGQLAEFNGSVFVLSNLQRMIFRFAKR